MKRKFRIIKKSLSYSEEFESLNQGDALTLFFSVLLNYVPFVRPKEKWEELNLFGRYHPLVCPHGANLMGKYIQDVECWYTSPRERNHFENVEEDGRIVLNCVSRKQDGKVWVQFLQRRNRLWRRVKCGRNVLKTWATLGLGKRTLLHGKFNCCLVFSLSLFPQIISLSLPFWGWQTKFYSGIKL